MRYTLTPQAIQMAKLRAEAVDQACYTLSELGSGLPIDSINVYFKGVDPVIFFDVLAARLEPVDPYQLRRMVEGNPDTTHYLDLTAVEVNDWRTDSVCTLMVTFSEHLVEQVSTEVFVVRSTAIRDYLARCADKAVEVDDPPPFRASQLEVVSLRVEDVDA